MAVGDEDGANAVELVGEVRDVGDHQIHAEHLFVREHQPGVNEDDVAVVLDGHAVLADLAQPAEGGQPERLGLLLPRVSALRPPGPRRRPRPPAPFFLLFPPQAAISLRPAASLLMAHYITTLPAL